MPDAVVTTAVGFFVLFGIWGIRVCGSLHIFGVV